MAIEPVTLDVDVEGRRVPALLFVPRSEAPLPLVLLGHGAHQSKDDPIAQLLASAIAIGTPAGVALIDAPGHGERRLADSTDAEFDRDVRRRMADPGDDAALAAEWSAVAAAARAAVPQLSGPTGYAGFSMGALFGLSIVADLPEVRAAVFALGGVWPQDGLGGTGSAARNERVRDGARRLGEREVLMLNMTRDEHFPMRGALEILETIPGPKRMGVWAGTHEQLPPEAMQLVTDFFSRTLA
jgi:dienelactone hydrolase